MMGFPDGRFRKKMFTEIDSSNLIFLFGLKNDIVPASPATQGLTAAASSLKGASGSPLFNNKGEVIGVQSRGGNVDAMFIRSHFVKLIWKADREYHKNLKQWLQREIATVWDKAKKGDLSAQFVMATYMVTERNFHRMTSDQFALIALPFYRNSAAQGYVRSQIDLGMIYLKGSYYGIPRDLEEGKKWLRLAVKQGKSVNKAHFFLGESIGKIKGLFC